MKPLDYSGKETYAVSYNFYRTSDNTENRIIYEVTNG